MKRGSDKPNLRTGEEVWHNEEKCLGVILRETDHDYRSGITDLTLSTKGISETREEKNIVRINEEGLQVRDKMPKQGQKELTQEKRGPY